MHLALLSNNKGLTLIEMIATLAIVSILAMTALPFVKMNSIRNKELNLQLSLRTIRSAIDDFHKDWEDGKFKKIDSPASSDGYPKTLKILVEGVPLAGNLDKKKKYLRKIPSDPFADKTSTDETSWLYIGYRDDPNTDQWNGEDVYDVRSRSKSQALNKSYYHDW